MNKKVLFGLGFLSIAIVALFLFFYMKKNTSELTKAPDTQQLAKKVDPGEEEKANPIEEVETSDATKPKEKVVANVDFGTTFEDAIMKLIQNEEFRKLINFEGMVHRIVLFVDRSLAQSLPPWGMMPINLPESDFIVEKGSDTISKDNSVRYKPYLDVLLSLEPTVIVPIYKHYYPLFQADFRELGTKKYFNDRLVEAIDNLLAAPELANPIPLKKRESDGRFLFQDEKLEASTAGQKVLIRIGLENERRVKDKLRAIRSLIAKKR